MNKDIWYSLQNPGQGYLILVPFRYRWGQIVGVIAGAEWELPAGFLVTISWGGLSYTQGICTAQGWVHSGWLLGGSCTPLCPMVFWSGIPQRILNWPKMIPSLPVPHLVGGDVHVSLAVTELEVAQVPLLFEVICLGKSFAIQRSWARCPCDG